MMGRSQLEAENESLRDRISALEQEIGIADADHCAVRFELTRSEAVCFGVLLKNRMASDSLLMTALYSHRPDGSAFPEILKIFVHKIRKKLRPYGIETRTVWGFGYEMPEASKARARELMRAA
jgi:DNA-binding response OmpR family regulator